MPDIRVQDEQGNIHIFPDGSTPEAIAQAMGVEPTKPPKKSLWEVANTPPGKDLAEQARFTVSNLASRLPESVRGPAAFAGNIVTAVPAAIAETGRRTLTPLGVATLGAGGLMQAAKTGLRAYPAVRTAIGAAETGLGSLFSAAGAREALTPRQEEESGLSAFERRTSGAGQALMGIAPVAHGAKETATTISKSLRTPSKAPGLSREATANLATPEARRGVEDIFRAGEPGSAKTDLPKRETISAVAGELAEMQRRTPLTKKGGITRPDYRLREGAEKTEKRSRDMYQSERMPQIRRNRSVEVDLRPVKQAIRDSVSPLDLERKPGVSEALQERISRMPDTETLAELDARYHQVNAERRAFRRMTDAEQAAVLKTDPAKHGLDAEHAAVQDAIAKTLEKAKESGVRPFDRLYGGLQDVSDMLAKRMNDAELGRLGAKVRFGVGTRGYASLFESLNPFTPPRPGRLLERGLKELAASPLKARTALLPPLIVPTAPVVVRDPRTGRMRRVYR